MASSQAAQLGSTTSVFKVKAEMDPLEKEKREIERRRERFEQRKQRILNPKSRLIGIDTAALDEQIKEKRQKELEERERDIAYDAQRVDHAKTIQALEIERSKIRQEQIQSVQAFRQMQSNETKARTNLIQSEQNNPILGKSDVFLNFAGEDPEKQARVKAQQQQQSEWLMQQIHLLSQKEQRDRQEQQDYETYQATIVQLQNANVSDAEKARLQAKINTMQTNQQLSQLKDSEKQASKEMNIKKDTEEIQYHLASSLLNEKTFDSSLGHNRTIPYHFKGFSQEKRQQILDEQKQQQDQLRDSRQRELSEEKDYANQQEEIRKQIIKQEREKQKLQLQRTLALKDELKQQKKQKDLRTQHLDKEVYTNPVSEEFFNQFGQSCR